MMMMFTMGIVAEQLSGTNAAVGTIAFAIGLSMFFLSPFGGVVADRINRKWLIVLGQGAGAAILALVGLLLVAGVLTLPLFFVLSLVLGVTFVFMSPARQAFTADIVGPRLVANAIVLSQMAHLWGQPFSPFVASILVKTSLGAGGTYITMAVLVFIGVATVALMRYRRPQPEAAEQAAAAPARSVRRDIAGGALYIWRRPQLRFMMALLLATIVVGSVFRIVLPRYMIEVLDRPAADQGLLLLVYGLGAAAAGLIIAGLATSRWAWPVLLGMIALMGLGHFVMAGAGAYGHAAVALGIMGPGLQGPMMLLTANIMTHTEPAYYGRVMSFTMMGWGMQMLIGLPVGVVADLLGEREVMGILGLLSLVIAAGGALGWLALIRRAPAPAVKLAETPDLRGAALPASNGASKLSGATGANGAGGLPAPDRLRPVALMSGQKPTG